MALWTPISPPGLSTLSKLSFASLDHLRLSQIQLVDWSNVSIVSTAEVVHDSGMSYKRVPLYHYLEEKPII